MADALTLAQIEERFQAEWVLIGDPQTTDALEIENGTVLWHSKDRDEVYRKAIALRPKRSAVLYTGQVPADTEIIL